MEKKFRLVYEVTSYVNVTVNDADDDNLKGILADLFLQLDMKKLTSNLLDKNGQVDLFCAVEIDDDDEAVGNWMYYQ